MPDERPAAPPPAVHRYRTEVHWDGSTGVGYEAYDRTHDGRTDPPTTGLRLSSDPAFRGDAALLNPEQLLLLSASSCQLLSFLAVAARARLDVLAYDDVAEAEMPEDDPPVRITHITLRPHITLAVPGDGRARMRDEQVARLVRIAHQECFIANSLRSTMTIAEQIEWRDPGPGIHT
jgi:organic hydroperoxide reductase OsmC/OhrA